MLSHFYIKILMGMAVISILGYAVYEIAFAPRIANAKLETKVEELEVNATVLAENAQVDIVDELNKYDANQTQIKIDELKDEYEEINEISVDIIESNGSHEWVFFSN